MTKKREWLLARLILLAFLSLGLAHGLVLPPFENLDEIEHFGAIRYLADTGRLPVHGVPAAKVYHYRQEASQPPLYYLLSAGLVRLAGLRAEDVTDFTRLNPWVACGPGGASLFDNRTVLYHNPNREAFPWQDTLLMLHALRAWSTLLQAVSVVGTFALVRLAFPRRRGVGLVAMALVALNPQFLLVASGVNNDNLVTPLATLGLYLAVRTWRDGLSVGRTLGLGLLTGLAGLSKLSGWLLLVPSAAVILALGVRLPHRRKPLVVVHLSLVILAAFAVAGWWLWRNWLLYQDPAALRPMLELVGAQDSPFRPLSVLNLMFCSFWGQIPCSFYPPGFYVFYGVLCVLAVGGLAWGWRELRSGERAAVAFLAGWLLIVVLGWLRWDRITPAPGGRLLFPALPATASLMAVGIGRLLDGRFRVGNWLVVGALALSAFGAVAYVLPGFFSPPRRYPDAATIRPDHPLDAELGEGIRLLGHDATLDERRAALDVTLYWQAAASIVEDYVLTLQLVSPVVGDTTQRWNYNSWPGRGNYPTSAWRAGEVIVDRYRFSLPKSDFLTQAWELHLALFHGDSWERLPIQVAGVPVGDRLVLTSLRVPGGTPPCPEEGRLTSAVSFAEAVALTHASVITGQEETRVVLCWEALQSLPVDYNVFVHLYDGSGALVNTGDGPPMLGGFPTSMWLPGDVVMDVHWLSSAIREEETGQRIAVGLYNLADGWRLPARVGGVTVPDDAVTVWPDRP